MLVSKLKFIDFEGWEMAEQTCPHCDRVITDKDLANYPLKLRRKELEKEYRGSDICRRHMRVFHTFLALCFMGMFVPIFVISIDSDNKLHFLDYSILLGVEILFGIVMVIWTIYGLTIRAVILKNDYVNSRIQEEVAQ